MNVGGFADLKKRPDLVLLHIHVIWTDLLQLSLRHLHDADGPVGDKVQEAVIAARAQLPTREGSHATPRRRGFT